MFKWLSSIRLPNLIGITLGHLCLAILVITGIAAASHFIWGEATTTYLWLLGISVWIFVHTKKSKSTWDRFDEIDQRDMDFKDEFDKKFEKIGSDLANKSDKPKPMYSSAEEYLRSTTEDPVILDGIKLPTSRAELEEGVVVTWTPKPDKKDDHGS